MCKMSTIGSLNEHIEHFSSNLHFITKPGFRFGTDAVLLAHFAAPRKNDTVWDLGTGSGIIPFLLDLQYSPKSITGVDIQTEACKLFARSIANSTPTSSMQVINSDIRSLPVEYLKQDAHLVTANPPYFLTNSGKISQTKEALTARHESTSAFFDFAFISWRLLRYGGRFCFCLKPQRLAEVIPILQNFDLEPKRLRFVSKDAQSAPWLFLLEARKGGKSGLQVESPLFLQNLDQTPTKEYLAIYQIFTREGETF